MISSLHVVAQHLQAYPLYVIGWSLGGRRRDGNSTPGSEPGNGSEGQTAGLGRKQVASTAGVSTTLTRVRIRTEHNMAVLQDTDLVWWRAANTTVRYCRAERCPGSMRTVRATGDGRLTPTPL